MFYGVLGRTLENGQRMDLRESEVLFSWFFLVMKTNPVLPAMCFLTAPKSNSKVH